MSDAPSDPNTLVSALTEAMYWGLERRFCTADAPMPEVDKGRYRWSHPDAHELGPFSTSCAASARTAA